MLDLARASEVSEPTVIRFCRALGFTGYREFRVRLVQDLASRMHYEHSEVSVDDSGADLVDKVIGDAIASLAKVRTQLAGHEIDAAIKLISGCSRIEIYGVGGAGIVASDAQLKFARLGLNVLAYSDVYLQRIAAGLLKQRSCVLAISNTGRSKDILASVKLARESGARIISITASASALAKLSDVHLAIDLDDEQDYHAPIKARIAHMAVVDTLAVGLAVRSKPAYLERLQNIGSVLDDKFVSLGRRKKPGN